MPQKIIKGLFYDSHRVYVQLEYDQDTFKTFQSYSKKFKFYYHPNIKGWVFTKSNARDALTAILRQFNLTEIEIKKTFQSAVLNNQIISFLTYRVHPVEDEDSLVVFSDFDWLHTNLFRSLKGLFDRENKAWIINSSIEDLIDALQEQCGIPHSQVSYFDIPLRVDKNASKMVFDTDTKGVMPTSGEKLIERRDKDFDTISATILHKINHIEEREFDIDQVLDFCNQIGAMPHQVEGIKFLLSRTSCLLADDMGLGKTLQAITAGHFTNGVKVVLCPKSLKRNWVNEIKKWTGNSNVHLCMKRNNPIPLGKDWYIFNYEMADIAARFLGEHKIAVGMTFFDEAHELKNPRSQKSRNSFEVAFYSQNRIIITGTPVLNKLNELHTLLMLSGHELGQMPRKEFLDTFGSDPSQTRRLKSLLDSKWMLRREKSILGKALPGKAEQIIEIDLSEHQRREYNELFKNMELDPIVKFGRLRKFVEDVKADFVADTVASIANEHKSLIFCEYKENLDRFVQFFEARDIECVTFSGSDSPKKRESAVEAIQNGSARVFIGTTKAAGVGITLTAADHVFFASLPWTQALKEQAEDRANRIGQKNLVKIITPIVVGTIDNHLKNIIDNKKALSECLVKDDLSPEVKKLLASPKSTKEVHAQHLRNLRKLAKT